MNNKLLKIAKFLAQKGLYKEAAQLKKMAGENLSGDPERFLVEINPDVKVEDLIQKQIEAVCKAQLVKAWSVEYDEDKKGFMVTVKGYDRSLGSLLKELEGLVDEKIITNVLTEELFDLKDMI